MANPQLIDYYAILSLPPKADLSGVENAYARLSDELVRRSAVDDTCHEALRRVNEAYAVLSKPELRRAYDRELFKEEFAAHERERRATQRRRTIASALLIGALSLIVLVQTAALVYIGHDELTQFFGAIGDLASL